MLAAQTGVIVVPGSRFGVDGTLERFLRLPFSLPAPRLVEAVRRLAAVWRQLDRSRRWRRANSSSPERPLRSGSRDTVPLRAGDAVERACPATAAATAGATRGSNGVGTMQYGASTSATTSLSAVAAAIFMFSVMARAPASNAPAKMPGKASTLLIWFG